MKTTVQQRVAKYLNVDISNVEIGESEHRENSEGKNLQNGCPVYVVMNTGVYEDELCNEFFGWVINGKWYRENC